MRRLEIGGGRWAVWVSRISYLYIMYHVDKLQVDNSGLVEHLVG